MTRFCFISASVERTNRTTTAAAAAAVTTRMCVHQHPRLHIQLYILPSVTRPYYDGVIRHTTARNFRARSEIATANFIVSRASDAVFFSCTPPARYRTLPYADASTFLPNAVPCNLWTDRRIDSLIESTWHGTFAFPRECAHAVRSFFGQWDLSYFSSVHRRVFENEVVSPSGVLYFVAKVVFHPSAF